MNQETVTALKYVDRFHKNGALLFEDLVRYIDEKPFSIAELATAGPSGYLVAANGDLSEYMRVLTMKPTDNTTDKFKFVQMLVKTREYYLDKSPGFKAVCKHLEVDPVFPLLLVTGVFEPRDVLRFTNKNIRIRRHWGGNTLLLDVPQHIRLLAPDCYRFDEWLTIESEPGTDSWYCEKAVFKIRRLLDIDSGAVEDVVDELFNI